MRILVWLREDLRVIDHPAFTQACHDGRVICGYIDKENKTSAKDFWLNQHVGDLQTTLKEEGIELIAKTGKAVEVLKAWVKAYEIDAVYFNRMYLKDEQEKESAVLHALEQLGVGVKVFHGDVLTEPGAVTTNKGEPYKVFTPYYKAWRQVNPFPPFKKPKHCEGIPIQRETDAFKRTKTPDWFAKLLASFEPGESAALQRLEQFIDQSLDHYSIGRDRPDLEDTTRLSVYLAVGAISPRTITSRLDEALQSGRVDQTETAEEIEQLKRQLCWRDFSYQQVYQQPQAETQALRREFDQFPWQDKGEAFQRWKEGRTGYPFVDAGMRELYQTGYMHNRVRMVAASFLVKHLMIDWRDGQKYFETTLLDHDRANNTLGWQWVMGSGFDASPFFRIFNPTTQAEKFDPEGVYIKRYLPELEQLDPPELFKPFETKTSVLKQASIVLDEDYPGAIVDHKKARARALSAYQDIKGGE